MRGGTLPWLALGLLGCAGTTTTDLPPDLATPAPPVKPGDAMPPGAISYFRAPECPTGWSRYALANGRVVVPISGSGDVGQAKGAPLKSGEVRAHGHKLGGNISLRSVSFAGIAGEANHGVAVAGGAALGGSAAAGEGGLPYVQLRLCQKTSAAVPSKRPIPAGTLAFFEQPCPEGWGRAGVTQGRFLVGLPIGGVAGLSFGGAPLMPGEVRGHSHDASGSVSLPSHGIALASGCCANGYGGQGDTRYTASAEAAEAGPPYLQLLQCQKL